MKHLLPLFLCILCCAMQLQAQDCGKLLQLTNDTLDIYKLRAVENTYANFQQGRESRGLRAVKKVPEITSKVKIEGHGVEINIPTNPTYADDIRELWQIAPYLHNSILVLGGNFTSLPGCRMWHNIERRQYTFCFADGSKHQYKEPYMHGNTFHDMFVLLAGSIPTLDIDKSGATGNRKWVAGDTVLLQKLMQKRLSYIEIDARIDAIFSLSQAEEHYDITKLSFTTEQATSLMQQVQCIDAARRRVMRKK